MAAHHCTRFASFAARQVSRQIGSSRSLHVSAASQARILCLDNIDPVCVEIFESRGHQADVKNKLTPKQLNEIIGDYDGMVIRSATTVTPDLLSHAKNLKVIGRAGVGIDNINLPEATRRGIMVMNTPGGNTVSTAQLAISLLCTCARRLAEAHISMKQDKWERKKFMGTELHGKTLAIVGCGRIGQTVAKWAQGFGMKVIGYDPVLSKYEAEKLGIKLYELDDLWANADFITLHTPLTEATRNMINDDTIAKMRDGVIIVNAARGGIVQEDALLRGLESGKVYSAALDVYSTEPPPESSKALINHPRLVCTPHLGASTEEAQVNVAKDVAVQMCDTLAGKDYVGVVNVKYMAMANVPEMKSYLKLAELMGKIASQSAEAPIKKVTLRTYGGKKINIESKSAREVMQAMMLKGLMSHVPGVQATPSLINAPFLAKEAKIEVAIDNKIHTSLVSSPYANVTTVEVDMTDGSKFTISGSVFGKEPIVVQIDHFQSFPAFRPEGHLLIFQNEDRPGAISEVLSILEEVNVNVARLHMARQEGHSMALCMLALDHTLAPEVMKRLQDLKTLRHVKLCDLNGAN